MLIFVQIAVYRDPLLGSTLRDLLEKAKDPHNLRITICHQYHPDDEFNEELELYRTDYRFNIIDILFNESRGLCWARNLVQHQYQGERFTLQIDSHMRFIWNWDSILIDMLVTLQVQGYQKPILTTYPPHFEPDDFEYKEVPPNQIVFNEFDKFGIYPIGWPDEIPNWKELKAPIPARFLAGGFMFTIGEFCKEILDDPNLYFLGEEINLAVRAYTAGYDLFHPHINITWHYYGRRTSPKHWDDHGPTEFIEIQAMKRLKLLFQSEDRELNYEWGPYGLGNIRTLKDYELYAGILFNENKVQEYTLNHLPAPNPNPYSTKIEWLNSFYFGINNILRIPNHLFAERDYDKASLIFMTNNHEVHQMTISDQDFAKARTSTEEFYTVKIEFYCRELPDTWILSLHSSLQGWENKIRGRMPMFVSGLGKFATKKCFVI